jgi:hypothetical protein
MLFMKYPDSNQLRKLIRGFCMRRQLAMLFHFIIEDFSCRVVVFKLF